MNKLTAFVDHFIFLEYRPCTSGLGIYRIIYAAYILTIYLPEYLWLSAFPESFYNPPISLTLLFATSFPSHSFFILLNALDIVSAVFLFFGFYTRISSFALALMLFVGNSWAYSFGKINHDLLLIVIPILMELAGWGRSYSMDAARPGARIKSRAWPISFFALIIGLAMMTAAEAKAASGWLNPDSRAVYAHMMRNVLVTGRPGWIAGTLLEIKSGLFWKSLDYGTVLLEASFLAFAFRRSAFMVVCSLACFFHLGIALSMQIAFVSNVLAYAAFYEWTDLQFAHGALNRWTALIGRGSWFLPAVTAAAIATLYLTLGNPVQKMADLFPRETDPFGILICFLAVVVSSAFLAGKIKRELSPSAAVSSVILFDGECALCQGWTRFILEQDHRARFRFASLQSQKGQDILKQYELADGYLSSLVLVEDEKFYCRSAAVLHIARDLGLPFSLAYFFMAVPRVLRDAVYSFIAKHRRWFGEQDTCRIARAGEESRFL